MIAVHPTAREPIYCGVSGLTRPLSGSYWEPCFTAPDTPLSDSKEKRRWSCDHRLFFDSHRAGLADYFAASHHQAPAP